MELVILSSMATAAMADTAAAPMTSSVTAAVSAAVSATATASLDPAGHHVLTQILVPGIVDLGLFAIKMLIDRKMKKKDICEQAGIATSTMAKMAKDENEQ